MNFVVLPFHELRPRALTIKIITLCIFGLLPSVVGAQVRTERAAWKALEKQRWDRSRQAAVRALEKDSLSIPAHYVMARYFFAPVNPLFQLDSAHHHALAAQRAYRAASQRQRERLQRFPLDSLVLQKLATSIDSAGFARAVALNTERAYIDFISQFRYAQQVAEAVRRRDEVAYNDAQRAGTYQAMHSFLTRYPGAVRVPEATARYERLLYEDMTRDNRYESFRKFLLAYPDASFRREAELKMFQIATAAGTPGAFERYLQQHPGGETGRRARAILFHLLSDEQQQHLPATLHSDSLATEAARSQRYLVPFLHEGTFGFMDAEGREIIAPHDSTLQPGYACGNIQDDAIILPGRVVARNGTVLFRGNAAVEDLGSGFMLLRTAGEGVLIHKSGWRPDSAYVDDARVLGGRFLATQHDGLWGIFTLAGLPLSAHRWDEVSIADSIVMFRANGKIWLATVGQLAALADQQPLPLKDPFDEVKPWSNGMLWVRAGKFQGVFDRRLQAVVPFADDRQFTPYFSGIVAELPRRWIFHNEAGEASPVYDTLRVSEPWIAARQGNVWHLCYPKHAVTPTAAYDSIFFSGPFAVGLKKDSATVHFAPGVTLRVTMPAAFEAVPGQDSPTILMIEQRGKKTVYNADGARLFTTAYERVQDAGLGLYVVSKQGKKGLADANAKTILPADYDAVGTPQDGIITLLKAAKFGAYNVRKKKLVRPSYGKNVVPYNAETLVAYRDGRYGFIGWDGKPLSTFAFHEVRPWNDSVALVKNDAGWQLYEIGKRKTVLENIRSFKIIRENAAGRLAIVRRENAFGVIDSGRGSVLPFQYSDIVNVGSREQPLYFTEKHVEEASIFVVIYYNAAGKLVRREVYEQDDYEKIYCTQSER